MSLKNLNTVIKLNQNGCLKPYIDMDTEPGKKKKHFEKTFPNQGKVQFL